MLSTLIGCLLVLFILVVMYLFLLNNKKQEVPIKVFQEKEEVFGYMQDRPIQLQDDTIIAHHVKALNIHLKENLLDYLKEQIQFSSMQKDAFIRFAKENGREINIDFGDEPIGQDEEDVRYVPVTLEVDSKKVTFDKTFLLHLYLDEDRVYDIHLYHRWTDEFEENLEVAYQNFVQNMQVFSDQGWKNYYYPHEARYDPNSESKLLEEQQRAIFVNNKMMSFEQFKACLNSDQHHITAYLYLDNVVISFLYTESHSVLMEISITDRLYFYEKHHLVLSDESTKSVHEGTDGEAFASYRKKAILVRAQAEKEAISQGYSIDENYVDPIS
jgi:hypothetical protein